jgi:hypothetical protein
MAWNFSATTVSRVHPKARRREVERRGVVPFFDPRINDVAETDVELNRDLRSIEESGEGDPNALVIRPFLDAPADK